MKVNWERVLGELRRYPSGVNRLRPPCPEDRLAAAQSILSGMPVDIVEMLRRFNGAKLFINGIQLVVIFGIYVDPPPSPLEWAPNWYIDRFTKKWFSSESQSEDLVIAMTNYGGLIVIDKSGKVREWDTQQKIWTSKKRSFDEWIEEMLHTGEQYMKE